MKSIKGLINFLIITVCLIFFSAFPVYAQDAQLLDVTIDEVKGDIEMMLPNTFDWVPIPEESGNTFSEGTQIRTGPFSSVTLVLGESSVVLVDSLTSRPGREQCCTCRFSYLFDSRTVLQIWQCSDYQDKPDYRLYHKHTE